MKRFIKISLIFSIISFGYIAHAQNLSWTPTKGPYSITINAFDTAHGVLFAGTKAGLFQSTNAGTAWSAVPSVPGLTYDIVTIGTNIFSAGSAITFSPDAGVTWITRDSGLPQFSLTYSLGNSHDTLYACLGGDGFYRSIDSGKYWSVANQDIANKTINSMIVTSSSIILAEGAGILRSTNGGFSWDEPTGAVASQTIHTFAIKDNILFAGTEAGVFRSTDDGLNWSQSGTGIGANDIITSLAISADHKTIFAGSANANSEVGIYRSGDGGNSWQLINNGLSNLTIDALFCNGSQVFTGTALGISRSDNNGDLWQTMSEGLPKPVVLSIATRNYFPVIAGTTGSYCFRTDNLGDKWVQQKNGLTRPNINALLISGDTIFAGTDAQPKQGSGGMHRSTDGGFTWTQINSGIPIMSIKSLASYGSRIYGCGDSGGFYSSDNGNSWTPSNNFVEKVLYSGNSNLLVATPTTVWSYSDNSGWSPTGYQGNGNILSLTMSEKYLYVGTDSGIYRDSQAVWTKVFSDTVGVQSLWSNSVLLVAGTKLGMYASSDNGNTWQFQQSSGVVSVNGFSYANSILYAATNSGVIKTPLAQFGVKPSSNNNTLSLEVTNPSTDHAIIRYHIDDRSMTSITAYDLLGRSCSQILRDEKDPGEYTLEWNTSSLANGTYILRLVSRGNQASTMINIVH